MPHLSPGAVFIPCTDTMPTKSVQAISRLLRHLPDRSTSFFGDGPWPPGVKRNLFARQLLQSGAEWALFVDSDMLPPPDLAYRLLEAGKDVVGVLYTCRHFPDKLEAGFFRGDEQPERLEPGESGEVVPVDWVGAGGLLVRRTVFETVADPWFQVDTLPPALRPPGGTRNADLGFCAKAGEAGFQVWCHTGIRVGHMGLQAVLPPER